MIRFLVANCLFLALLFTACGGGNSSVGGDDAALPPADPSAAPAPAPETPAEELAAGDQLVTWVDRVNIREAANTSAKVVTNVPNGEAMTYTGEKSGAKEAILLRGIVYQEEWIKIKTKDGLEGWVFGGAVKRPDEQKGNQIISATQLDFPYFGRYDLSNWKELDTASESGGDAESKTKRYQKEGQILSVTETDMGDYGYGYSYKLTDVEDRVLLERELSFQADMDMLLTETVTNRIESPAVEYSRSEKLPSHPVQLNGRPMMVNGSWTKKAL